MPVEWSVSREIKLLMSTTVLTRYKSLALADPSHQSLIRALVTGRIVAQGPVGVTQGLDRRKLADLIHVHTTKPDSNRLDFLPKSSIVVGITDIGRHVADDDVGTLRFQFGARWRGETSASSN